LNEQKYFNKFYLIIPNLLYLTIGYSAHIANDFENQLVVTAWAKNFVIISEHLPLLPVLKNFNQYNLYYLIFDYLFQKKKLYLNKKLLDNNKNKFIIFKQYYRQIIKYN